MKTMWHNGKMYTMRQENEKIEAMLTENGQIISVGKYEVLKEQADKIIDLQGATLYPGFVDSHMHMIWKGQQLLSLDFSTAKSADDMLEMLRQESERLSEGEWLLGGSWDENKFPDKKILTRYELDEVTNTPMLLKRTCRHASLVNSKALELAGITKDTPDPVDGVIVRDQDGEPTGYLQEGAQRLVSKLIPKVTEEVLTKALSESVDHLLSLGLTGAQTDDLGDFGPYQTPLQAFKNVIGDKKKKFRAHLLRRHTVFQDLMEGATYDEPWIEPGAMKFFIDGALGARTALLSEPYTDAPETAGVAMHSAAEVAELVKLARSHGEAIAVHAIGDAAVERALDAMEAYPAPKGKRDRLIHVSILREDLVERMLKLPVVLDIQPPFVTSDFPWAEDRLGEARLSWAYAWKKLLDKGFICAGGSDAPIEKNDPLFGIYTAIMRRNPNETHNGYLPEEKLSRFEAVSLYTTGSASVIGKAHSRGQLAVGFDADFTVLDKDLFEVEVESIIDANVVMTVVGGDVMYSQETTTE